MSSTYYVLCLSHDPAVVAADRDWNRPGMPEAAIASGIEGHEQCDLMIGRRSGGLVELGCPTSMPRRAGQAAPRLAGSCCWTGGRVERLRVELGVPERCIQAPPEDADAAVDRADAREPFELRARTPAESCRYLADRIADLAFGDPTVADLDSTFEGIRLSLVQLAERLDQ